MDFEKAAGAVGAECVGEAGEAVEDSGTVKSVSGEWVEGFLRDAPVVGRDEAARLRRVLFCLAS